MTDRTNPWKIWVNYIIQELKARFKPKEIYSMPVDISISLNPEDPEQAWDFKSFSFAKDRPHLLHV